MIYGAETWSLYVDDRRRINTTEMDALRRSARISELDRKTNEYIRGNMNAQDIVTDRNFVTTCATNVMGGRKVSPTAGTNVMTVLEPPLLPM
jgi:hypothetical protein